MRVPQLRFYLDNITVDFVVVGFPCSMGYIRNAIERCNYMINANVITVTEMTEGNIILEKYRR